MLALPPDSTAVTGLRVHLSDASTGADFTTATAATAEARYQRDGGTETVITLTALASASAAYSSGGFVHVRNGVYRLDPPAAALAAGASVVNFTVTQAGAVLTAGVIRVRLDAAVTAVLARATEQRLSRLDNEPPRDFVHGDRLVYTPLFATPSAEAHLTDTVTGSQVATVTLTDPEDINVWSAAMPGGLDVSKTYNVFFIGGGMIGRGLIRPAGVVRLAATQPMYAPAKAGDAMTLTPAERETTAGVVESHLLDEADGQLLVNALVGAINNVNVDEVALVAAIRSDVERSGGPLTLLTSRASESRLSNLDATISSRAAATALPTNFGLLGINASGHVSRVTLVDTTTDNTDMRGTDWANTTPPDNAGIGTLLTRASEARLAKLDVPGTLAHSNDAATYKADVSGLLTAAAFAAALPPNFGGLLIQSGTGLVTATNGGGGGTQYAGPIVVVVTVRDDDGVPIHGARVRLQSATTSYDAVTGPTGKTVDADGTPRLAMIADAYTLLVTRDGFSHAPQSVVIDAGTSEVDVVMARRVVVAPPDPATVTAWLVTLDGRGVIAPNAVIEFRLIDPSHNQTDAAGQGLSWSREAFRAMSNAAGLLTVTLHAGALYEARRGGDSRWPVKIAVPLLNAGDTYELPEILGRQTG